LDDTDAAVTSHRGNFLLLCIQEDGNQHTLVNRNRNTITVNLARPLYPGCQLLRLSANDKSPNIADVRIFGRRT